MIPPKIWFINTLYLVGGWATPLKNMSSSFGMIIPNICKNKKCSKPPTSYAWYTFPFSIFFLPSPVPSCLSTLRRHRNSIWGDLAFLDSHYFITILQFFEHQNSNINDPFLLTFNSLTNPCLVYEMKPHLTGTIQKKGGSQSNVNGGFTWLHDYPPLNSRKTIWSWPTISTSSQWNRRGSY